MDFNFTEEQEEIRKMLADFAKKELLPRYTYWDRQKEFPRELWKKLGEIGVTGTIIPVEYEGQGADALTSGIVIEELGKGDINVACSLTIQMLAIDVLKMGATEKVKREWFPPVARGEKILALALTEPHCGTDASAIRSTGVRKGDSYVLNGEKSGISLVTVADAIIIFVKTKPEAGAKGVSAFLVPRDLPGVTIQTYEDMGHKSVFRGSIFMDDVVVPAENLVGVENDGFKVAMAGFDKSRVLLGLMALGAAQATLEETIRYTKERHAFGRPLATFEGVSFTVAEHASLIEAVRWLSYRSLWLADQNLPHTKEAAMCKWMAPKFSVEAIHDCLLLHGHYGYTQEFPVEQRLRDAVGVEIADGTSQVAKIVISRELFGRDFRPY